MRKVGILLKIFSKEEYKNDFLSGKIYMNTIQYFRDFEDSKDGNVADKHEAIHGWLQPGEFKLMIGAEGDMREIDQDSLTSPMTISLNSHMYSNIFCMTQLHSHDIDMDNLKEGDLDKLKEFFTLPEDVINLGKYAVVIHKPSVFTSRFRDKAQELYNNGEISWYQSKQVSYYDEVNKSVVLSEMDAPFYKQSKFSHQNEYRFLVMRDNGMNKAFTVDIGDIRDMCSEIATEEFNELIEFK